MVAKKHIHRPEDQDKPTHEVGEAGVRGIEDVQRDSDQVVEDQNGANHVPSYSITGGWQTDEGSQHAIVVGH